MTLELGFEGWFQCRLATDPDPYDEPAGVSGTTVALAWERPLDRVIRFNRPVDPRSGAPVPGVSVRAVQLDGIPVPAHPLVGASVDLADDSRFEGRNGLVADDGTEPIVPFAIRVRGAEHVIEREDPPGPSDTDGNDQLAYAHRLGGNIDGSPAVAEEILDAVRIPNRHAWAAAREEHLVAAQQHETDAGRRAGLATRLDRFRSLRANGSAFVAVRVTYGFGVGAHGGRGTVHGAGAGVPEAIDVRQPWPLAFWLGGWDADGLCGYVRGTLGLPLRAPP